MYNNIQYRYAGFNPITASDYSKEVLDKIEKLETSSTRATRKPRNYGFVELANGEQAALKRWIFSGFDSKILDGTSTLNADIANADEDAQKVYEFIGKISEFYQDVFRRNGLRGQAVDPNSVKPTIAVVNYSARLGSTKSIANAYWDYLAKQMYFGAGNNASNSYASDLTVVAHEYTHGVIQHINRGLGRVGQPGALNESIADIFACMIAQYWNWDWKTGQFGPETQKISTANATWQVGEYLFRKPGHNPVNGLDIDYVEGMAVRSLKDPGVDFKHNFFSSIGKQPKEFKNYKAGGVNEAYNNCGIPSHAFYKFAESLGGNSWEKAGKVWYQALGENKDPNIDFLGWAKCTKKATQSLFSKTEVDALEAAWKEVGINI